MSGKRDNITIAFMGDVMLGRLVNEIISEKGYAYPWGNMLSTVKEADIKTLNLETTLTKSTKIVPKAFNFKARPDRVKTLLLADIDVVNLANNHILDFSEEGLMETIKVLDEANILHVGAGKNEAEARKSVSIEKEGIRLGIIGYTDNEPDWATGPMKPGTNYLEIGDIKKIKDDVSGIRDKVDILIMSVHWGPNMRERPTPEFINFSHKIIESGVDIIHGHSAHVFQGIERHKSGLIMYDTGDFIDDYAVDWALRNDRSFLFNVEVDKEGVGKVELMPVSIDNMQVNLAVGNDYAWLMETLKSRCAGFKTSFSRQGMSLVLDG